MSTTAPEATNSGPSSSVGSPPLLDHPAFGACTGRLVSVTHQKDRLQKQIDENQQRIEQLEVYSAMDEGHPLRL